MRWMPIRAGRDHLKQYAKQPPLDALAELVWNALDAEADEVDVEIETATMGEAAVRYVTRVVVSDNGHGITPEVAEDTFNSLGDSWKKQLNGRTLNGKRALHGQHGRGRLFAYSLGHHVRWTSVHRENNKNRKIEIVGDVDNIDGFHISEPEPTTEEPGTRVLIFVEQGRSLTRLLRDDLTIQMTARFAPHLLANRNVQVRIDGVALDAANLVESGPVDIVLDGVPPESLQGREVPVLTIVDWSSEVRGVPDLMLCNADGIGLMELDRPPRGGALKSTGYLRWSGFAASSADLVLAQMNHPEIVDEAFRVFASHTGARLREVTANIVRQLKEEESYPYSEAELSDPIKRAGRDMFDLVAVTARGVLSTGGKLHRAMSAKLLRLALEERPADLDIILTELLKLPSEDQAELADMLRYSTLGGIVGAAAEVSRRLDLITALRHLIYDKDVSKVMREVDQLHPLVRDNVWLFGEDWRLTSSEAGLTTILRSILADDALLENEVAGAAGKVLRDNGKSGRVDLVLQRTLRSPGRQNRLLVELKRPSIRLGEKELGQVKSYARALAKHSGIGQSHWSVWLVGSSIKGEIEDELKQRDRAYGHVVASDHYDVRVATWGALLDDAETRFQFYREQLSYDLDQDVALERVRERHNALLPDDLSTSPLAATRLN